ncbi:hypothetical protein JCGZ_04411 [Jatropha curcas]|uniref:Uncharacterized protein n=2 Tax=Jatropha curcas TaxID=180498 RepID=A0A067KQI9_JATCU|nr:hypothetical protein JCGZ_04411 [Jatropha curcas]
MELNEKGYDVGESELDDINFGNMTLQQIKERCKGKKGKCSTYVDLSKEAIETCSLGKQNQFDPQSEEDEYDIMEPLSCWKSRILTKKKTKRKCRKKSVSASSQNVLSIVKFEETPSDQLIYQSNGDFPAPIDIKVEVPEPSNSDCRDMIIGFVDSGGVVPFEDHETSSDYNLETGTLMIAWEEPDTSNDYDLETGTSIITGEDPDRAKDYLLEAGRSVISDEQLTTNACGFESQMPNFFRNEPQYCAVNEESFDVEHPDPKSILDIQASGGKIMMQDIAELIGHQFSDLCLSEAKKEDFHPKTDFLETVSLSENHTPVMCYKPQSFPSMHEKSRTSNDCQVQVPDVTISNSLQHMELSKKNDSRLPEDEMKGEGESDTLHVEVSVISSPIRDYSSLSNSKVFSSPKRCSVSVAGHSPTGEEKQSPSSGCNEAASRCSTLIHSRVDEPVTSAKDGEHHRSKLQHAPERLLSTRMAISPTTQKRLREAMESTELDDEQYYKYARKLCYSKKTENRLGRLEEANQIKRAEVIISSKKVVKQAKIGSNGFHQNDTLKLLHPSRAVQHFSTGCSSIRSCSESAILFSQQQMHDFQSVTTKLAKELQSMKDIVEETLQSKQYPAMSLKYSADEVRIAIQNATRVEENARRSLSIMARDCNRFCKIMKLAEKGSSSSHNAVCKKRKIVFADEAGGKLCDVKTFENDTTSFMDPKREKP